MTIRKGFVQILEAQMHKKKAQFEALLNEATCVYASAHQEALLDGYG